MKMKDGLLKEEENRREASLASNPCLQPNFRSASLTQSQISKFQELHRKRLQVKAKFNKQKKHKVTALKLQEEEDDLSDKDEATLDSGLAYPTGQSTFGDCSCKDNSSVQPSKPREQLVLRTRQKLYWGLDVKERWERKSNM